MPAYLPTDSLPLTSSDARRHNLPIQLTSFIGRAREIAEIKRLLSNTRLVTLTGTRGAGKTRLAVQAAADAGILAPNFASAVGVFLIRQSVAAIPNDLIEAARIDGAGETRIVLTIVAPLIKAMLVTIALLLFLSSWNDFLWPEIIINSEGLRTLPVGIALFKDPYGNIDYGPLMAGAVISTAPMLIAYMLLQRFMIRGITLTGLK